MTIHGVLAIDTQSTFNWVLYFAIKGAFRKLGETDMEFVTCVTSSARVKFFWVKFTKFWNLTGVKHLTNSTPEKRCFFL